MAKRFGGIRQRRRKTMGKHPRHMTMRQVIDRSDARLSNAEDDELVELYALWGDLVPIRAFKNPEAILAKVMNDYPQADLDTAINARGF